MKGNGPQNRSDIVIIDETEACPYLPGQVARMPLRMPLQPLTREAMDAILAAGNRRTGEFIYRTQCPECRSCLPIRLDCQRFSISMSKHWRRELNRGNRRLKTTFGPIVALPDRVQLFNKHRVQRRLARQDSDIDLEEYHWGFIKSCYDSFEISYHDPDGQLAGIAICDQGKESLSAVYTFYDPDFSGVSIGTYSILKQVEYCQRRGLRYLYLGFYVPGSLHMKYKHRFRPHELLIDGVWKECV
jgi:arginine-tRNA-protein transferase